MSDTKIENKVGSGAGSGLIPNAKGERRGGRKKGTPNKTTKAFRETVQKLLDDNAENVAQWLSRVAAEDPDKALQRLAQLAEYAAPKLNRTEVVGEGGGPVQVAAVEWQVVDAPKSAGS